MSNPESMTPDEITAALDRLVGDSLAIIHRALREQSKPSKAVLDTAKWLIERAVEAEPAAEVVDPDAAELAGVLELVRG
jgi:Ser/Thr protein kinase RdoA (MazF antagonist)